MLLPCGICNKQSIDPLCAVLCLLFFCSSRFGLSFCVESVKPTGIDEKIESLWGDDKADPKDALEANGFLMRTVTLHATPGRRGRGYRGRHGGANKNGKKPANGGGETAPAATEAKPE